MCLAAPGSDTARVSLDVVMWSYPETNYRRPGACDPRTLGVTTVYPVLLLVNDIQVMVAPTPTNIVTLVAEAKPAGRARRAPRRDYSWYFILHRPPSLSTRLRNADLGLVGSEGGCGSELAGVADGAPAAATRIAPVDPFLARGIDGSVAWLVMRIPRWCLS